MSGKMTTTTRSLTVGTFEIQNVRQTANSMWACDNKITTAHLYCRRLPDGLSPT